jgi:hypothetical protein
MRVVTLCVYRPPYHTSKNIGLSLLRKKQKTIPDERIFFGITMGLLIQKNRFLSDLTKEKNLDFIALLETGRANFPQSTLKNIYAGRDFLWHCMAPRGRSGGMILGINLSTFDIGQIEGDFFN